MPGRFLIISPAKAAGGSGQGAHIAIKLADMTPFLTPEQQDGARQRRVEVATLKELADNYDVSSATISSLAR